MSPARRRSPPRKSGDATNGNGKHKDSDAVLSAYDDRYLECRGINHPWRQMGLYRRGGNVVRRLSCPRCTTIREDEWSLYGERLSHRYIYPEGYSIQGQGHVAPVDIRVEVIQRAQIFDSEEVMVQQLFKGSKRG